MSHTRFLHLFLMGQENCVSCAFRTHNLQSSPDLVQASGQGALTTAPNQPTECNRIIGSIYSYSLNFATLFVSHLSSILALFFLKSLVKLLLHDERSSILTQVLLFHQVFHCYKCSYSQKFI